jgi:hypothetical protein
MIIYLRNEEGLTLVDVEITKSMGDPNNPEDKGHVDLQSVVMIDTYTDLLLKNLQAASVLKFIFQELQELRSWIWGYFLENNNEANEYDNVVKEVRRILSDSAFNINNLCTTNVFVVED